MLGWERIENPELVQPINEMYEAANLLTNFFCANRHVIHKERRGSRYYKRYDKPVTPADRLLASDALNQAQRIFLTGMKGDLS